MDIKFLALRDKGTLGGQIYSFDALIPIVIDCIVLDKEGIVRSCTTAKEIWDSLKELYSTDEDLEHSIQTLLLSEFSAFEQKPDEKLIQTFDRFNHLLSKMMKHGIGRKVIEQKVTFMNGLRPEWMVVVSTVKAHEQFKSYSLAKLMGIFKSHESVVTKEAKVVSGVGSLAVVSKNKNVVDEEEESDLLECDLTNEEYAMMGSYSFEKTKEENKNTTQKDDEEKERKLVGDSGYECNYCHGKNHFVKDCMLRKMSKKREGEDDKEYYMRILEEIKIKKSTNVSMNALIVKEHVIDDEFGGVEVWSTDSEDEEVINDEQFDDEWYIDSGCSHHMTGRREELREFQSLKDGGCVKYGNNSFGTIKGNKMITNGEFSIRKVAYVEGLQHNLISVSQLVVLKSLRKSEMYPLNLNPIRGKPVVCLLTKANSEESWLWQQRLSHLNFKDINKLVLGDHKSEATPKLTVFYQAS
ncbi:uncharacterized protein LOC128134106 [Lactuca sativa]|uniref:uncharacterized protein LOC128134106 n=1 Tax=Lactuca sativa TaxID=4236 RepID=UPI0022B06BE5|nr:uncharacterized protein LOC128134106 [Lactuca sativa]